MSNRFFITGTDTGVGKTLLSALLCAALDAVYWKPVQTGAIGGTDRETVLQWAEMPAMRALPSTYCFDPPVSPHLAARLARRRIDIEKIPSLNIFESQALIVEGAGGVRVPLNETQFMTDLMRHIGFPVVLACRSGLGTINHTLLSLAALRSEELNIAGIVMIGETNPENRDAIERFGQVRVIGSIPHLETIDKAALLRVFREQFDHTIFRSAASVMEHSSLSVTGEP